MFLTCRHEVCFVLGYSINTIYIYINISYVLINITCIYKNTTCIYRK